MKEELSILKQSGFLKEIPSPLIGKQRKQPTYEITLLGSQKLQQFVAIDKSAKAAP